MFVGVVWRLVLIFGLELSFRRLKILFPRFSSKVYSFHCLIAISAAPFLRKDALIRSTVFRLYLSGVFSAALIAKVSATRLPVTPWCPDTHRTVRVCLAVHVYKVVGLDVARKHTGLRTKQTPEYSIRPATASDCAI